MQRKGKWIFTVIAILLFIIVSSGVPDDPLGSRAMAVGLGIDCDGEGNIIACAQILTSAEGEDKPAGTRVVEKKSKLLSTAISKITEDCGMTLTVTHCNVIILGENLIKSGSVYKELFTLLENTYVSDNAYIFGCEGAPKDIYGSTSAFGNNASQYLQKLVASYGTYDNIPYKTVRQIIVDYHNIGKAAYLPYIEKVPVPPKNPSSSSDSSTSSGEAQSDYAYNLNSVRILRDGLDMGLYGENASKAINYLLTKVDKGSDEFAVEKGILGVYVLNNKVKQKLDLEQMTCSYTLKIGVTVKDFKPNGKADEDEKTFSFSVKESDKKICADIIKTNILDFFYEMQEKDVDIFEIRQSFYSQFGKKAESISLKDVKLKLNVELSVEN